MLHNSTIKDYLMLHFIVMIWGFTAILGLLISIPSVEIVFYRTLMASGFLGLVFLVKKQKIKLSNQELAKVIGTGFLISLHWILFFWAAQVSTASVCLFVSLPLTTVKIAAINAEITAMVRPNQ